MRWLSILVFRVKSLFGRRKLDAEMTEEMRVHLEMETEARIAAGKSPEEARCEALREFGNVASVQEKTREERGWVWLEQIWKDLGFAVRSLNRSRGFTFTVIATLSVGICVAALVFNYCAIVVLFSQPFPQAEQLYVIGSEDKQGNSSPYQFEVEFQAYREQVNVFSEFAAVTRDNGNVLIDGEPVLASLINASEDCFRVLAVKPVIGRGFFPDEHRPGKRNVAVITDTFWRKYFHADPDVLGRKLIVDQQVCSVIGVFARNQYFPPVFQGEVYLPLELKVTVDPTSPLAVIFLIGRLRPGVSPEQAAAALAAVKLPALPPWAAAAIADKKAVLMGTTDGGRPDTYWVMIMAALMLYLIACLNVMNLMLVRLQGRRRELSIRLSLGGTQWQIARLLVFESVGLVLAACVVATFAEHWLYPRLVARVDGNDDALLYTSFWSGNSLACIAALSLLASVAIALVPAWRLHKGDANPRLKEGTAVGENRRVTRWKNLLVVLQAAFAVILLVGTGLMVRSFERLQHLDLGFEAEGRVKVRIIFPHGYELSPELRLQLFQRLQQRLAALPGVQAVSYGQDALMVGNFVGNTQLLMPDGSYRRTTANLVGEDFLKTSGMVMKKGRWLSGRRGEFEVVISESFAKARFGDKDPIGQTFKLQHSGDYGNPVVGVVADVRETVRSVPGLAFYVPNWVILQNIDTLLLRLERDPGKEFAGLVRHAIYESDPKLIAGQVRTFHEIVGDGVWSEHLAYTLLKGLSSVALILAVVGVFSVLTFTVNTRMQEFGVRMALGASHSDLRRLVIGRGLGTAAIGISIGIIGALGLTRFIQSLLFETTPNDPMVYTAVAAVMLLAAVIACWLPARRAARADPIVALRAE